MSTSTKLTFHTYQTHASIHIPLLLYQLTQDDLWPLYDIRQFVAEKNNPIDSEVETIGNQFSIVPWLVNHKQRSVALWY